MYSEIVVFQVAEVLGLDYVKYEMVKWSNIKCVRSKLFTSDQFGYLTMTEYLTMELGSKTKWRYHDTIILIDFKSIRKYR